MYNNGSICQTAFELVEHMLFTFWRINHRDHHCIAMLVRYSLDISDQDIIDRHAYAGQDQTDAFSALQAQVTSDLIGYIAKRGDGIQYALTRLCADSAASLASPVQNI